MKFARPSTTFQFHKGTIKTIRSCTHALEVLNFNSIKVRLRRRKREAKYQKFANFNSIKVRLRQHSRNPVRGSYHHFNSIKVRLRRRTRSEATTRPLFQFHKGTIKTLFTDNTIFIDKNFNSIKVRLRL